MLRLRWHERLQARSLKTLAHCGKSVPSLAEHPEKRAGAIPGQPEHRTGVPGAAKRRVNIGLRSTFSSKTHSGTSPENGKQSVTVGFEAKNRFRLRNGFSSRFQDKAASA